MLYENALLPVITLLSESEYGILNIFLQNPLRGWTIRSLALRLSRPYPQIYNYVQKLYERNILLKHPVGASHICYANLASEEALLTLSMVSVENLRRNPDICAEEILALLSSSAEISSFSPVILVFGDDLLLIFDEIPSGKPFRNSLLAFKSSLNEIVSTHSRSSKLLSSQKGISVKVNHSSSLDFFPRLISYFASSLNGPPSAGKHVSSPPVVLSGHYSYVRHIADYLSNSVFSIQIAGAKAEVPQK